MRHVFSPARFLFVAALVCAALTWRCNEDRSRGQSPTAPSMAASRVSGTLVRESGPASPAADGGAPLAGVTVTLTPSGRTTITDPSGAFTFESVPSGRIMLQFDGPGVHASTPLSVSDHGDLRIRVSVSHNTATLQPRGDSNGEVEGTVRVVDSGGGSLTVADERSGMVIVKTTSTTIIRRGEKSILLADIAMGDRVHAKGTVQKNGTFLATEIIVQDQELEHPTSTPTPGGASNPDTPTPTRTPRPEEAEVSGTIQSFIGSDSFLLMTRKGSVTVKTNASTMFEGEHDAMIGFSTLKAGDTVEVEGARQSDGSILAREVKLENEDH